MVSRRRPDGAVKCPDCDSEKVTYLERTRVYRCSGDHPRQKFSLKLGAIFEDSQIPLEKWLPAMWMLVNCKNGIISYEIHRALRVTQKSAWFMLHRIRLAMQAKSFVKLGGRGHEVEVDETFIGGAARNMHPSKRRRAVRRSVEDKAAVLGMLDRGREVRAFVVPTRRKVELQGRIRAHVKAHSAIYTDALMYYQGLHHQDFVHQTIDYAESYVDGQVHTNGLENFWSLLKRCLKGTYISTEPFHLFRYLDEQVFRHRVVESLLRVTKERNCLLKRSMQAYSRRLCVSGILLPLHVKRRLKAPTFHPLLTSSS